MAISFTGTRGLFTILGKVLYAAETVNTFRGTTLPTENEDAVETTDGGTDLLRNAVAPDLLAAEVASQFALDAFLQAVRKVAEQLVIKFADDDNPLVEKTAEAAVREVVRQMESGGYYVTGNAITATITETNLTGTGSLAYSLKDAFGRSVQNAFAEDLEVAITSVATAGQESVEVEGEEAENDRLSWLYPSGSSGRATYDCCDAADTTSNLVPNGAFENWTSSSLDNWTAAVGAFGTNWVKEATIVYKGTYALKLVGDGSSLWQIYTDLSSVVEAGKQYAINIWGRDDGTPAAAGVLTVDLHDGSSVINDNFGTANSQTIALTTIGSTYIRKLNTVAFRLPDPLPTTVRLRLRLSTALTNTRAIYFDHLGMKEAVQIYDGGPSMMHFSGATNYSLQDYSGGGATRNRVHKLAIGNDGAGKWQTWFPRLFDMRAWGLVLPSSGSSLINDNLIS